MPRRKKSLRACIHAAPGFDQAYLNLARMYVVLRKKKKKLESTLGAFASKTATAQDGSADAATAILMASE